MQVTWRHYIKVLCLFLLIFNLFTFSIKPATQDLEAITPTSQLTLLGQTDVQKTDRTTNNTEEGQLNEPNDNKLQPEQRQEKLHEQPNNSLHSETNPPETLIAHNSLPVTNEQTNQIEITDTAEIGDFYFTTNLHNNQIVTEPNYYVVITHLDSSLEVKDTVVELNNQNLTDFSGELLFIEGLNIVTITISYRTTEGEVKLATQTYHITLDTKNIVIDTTAQNEVVTGPVYHFIAKAMRASDMLPLEITLNDEPVKAIAGNFYSVTLKPGDNHLKITATDGTNTKQINATVHYKEEQAYLAFETDLVDQKVSIPTLTFTAQALYGDKSVPFTAYLNGNTLPDQTSFEVQLVNGTNTIQLQTSYKGEQLSKQFKVLYSDPTTTQTKPVDEKAPKLKTDLKTGSHVKGLIKTINVWPITAQGERIRGKNVTVKVNGVGVPFVWDDSEKTSYKLTLNHGENTVEIRAWDDEGRVVKETFMVTAEDLKNGVIGHVTISVEATVLGIPYLIPPTKMEIHQGEKGSYIVDQLLRKYGYSYVTTGTLDSNFYLAAIKKPNMLPSVSIPDDLWTLVKASSTRAVRDDYSKDSLGEFNFANGSGWMFSLNGDYPNYGFSDAYFLDGDVVRIRYTLQYGRDIGGAGGSNAGSNWDKEW